MVGFTAAVASASAGAQTLEPLTVHVTPDGSAPVRADERLELHLSRTLAPSDGRLSVFVDRTDVTPLFVGDGQRLVYRSDLRPIPAGTITLLIRLISAGEEWVEAARVTFVVETPQVSGHQAEQGEARRGGWTHELAPTLTANIAGQGTIDYSPSESRPSRENTGDLTVQAGGRAGLSSGHFSSGVELDVVGVSYRPQALRYGELGEGAPRVDLSSYLVTFGAGPLRLEVGHTRFGSHRFLASGFSSRGLVAAVALGGYADLSLAAMNGTSIVGWSNPLGLERREHRIWAGTLGLEFLPSRPGGARLELSTVDGSLLPLSSYTQSHLSDAEKSRGLGARLTASDARQRFRLEAGYARSRFDNPADPLLDQGAVTVPVETATREAYYLDADLKVLQDRQLAPGWASSLTLVLRHSRVEPLYRSVAVYTQADQMSSHFQAAANIGEIVVSLGHERGEDNLADVPSILTSLTRRTSGQFAVPLAALHGPSRSRSALLPILSWTWDSTRQRAEGLPENGDFEPSALPDQVSTSSMLSADWQLPAWRFGCRWNRSLQDNRQQGRERDDLENSALGLVVGLSPRAGLDVTVDVSHERSRNHATEARYEIVRGILGVTVKTGRRSVLSLSAGATSEGDEAGSNRSRNLDTDAQWSVEFKDAETGRLSLDGQFFIRYARRAANAFDRVFLIERDSQVQTANAGVRITLH